MNYRLIIGGIVIIDTIIGIPCHINAYKQLRHSFLDTCLIFDNIFFLFFRTHHHIMLLNSYLCQTWPWQVVRLVGNHALILIYHKSVWTHLYCISRFTLTSKSKALMLASLWWFIQIALPCLMANWCMLFIHHRFSHRLWYGILHIKLWPILNVLFHS